jgi:hypothetical protein
MFNVYEKPCKNFLFSENRIVSEERANQLISECLDENRHFLCHKSTINNDHVCCHAFYKKYKNSIWYMAFAERLKMVLFLPLPDTDKNKITF